MVMALVWLVLLEAPSARRDPMITGQLPYATRLARLEFPVASMELGHAGLLRHCGGRHHAKASTTCE